MQGLVANTVSNEVRACFIQSSLARVAFLVLALLCSAATTIAQKTDDWWKMLGTQKANPKQSDSDALVYKPVKWAFPADGIVSVDLDGQVFYQLAPEALGKNISKNGVDTALILFSPKLVATALLAQIEDPAKMPDLDRFLAAVGVMLAVETPKSYTDQYLANGKRDNLLLYFFRTKSGANVGATVSSDHRRVLVVPAPSEP